MNPSDDFDMYEAAVRVYASSWFLSDEPALDTLRRNSRARSAALALAAAGLLVGTDIVYQVQPSRWTPERSVLQSDIVDRLLRESSDSGSARAQLPVAVILMGLPGSGKSSILRPLARELCARVGSVSERVIDADAARELLPEYEGGIGSEVVQVETAFIAYSRLVEATYAARGHVILDTVGEPERTLREAEYLTDAGWTVALLCAHVDVETAVRRVIHRALTNGRFVPPEYVRHVGDRPIRAFQALRDSGLPLLGAALLATDGPVGSRPKVMDTDKPFLFGSPGSPTLIWPSDEVPTATIGSLEQ